MSQVIRSIEYSSRDMFHEDVALGFPVLNCKKLNVDVARSFCGLLGIDELDSRSVNIHVELMNAVL